MSQWNNQLVSDKAVYRTTPATLGLLKTQIVTKLKPQIVTKLKNSKTPTMTKLKNSNCDKFQKLKLQQNLKTKILTKLKLGQNSKTQNVTTQKVKFWQNSKGKLWQNSIYNKTLKESFNKNNLTPRQRMRCSLGSVSRFFLCLMRKRLKTQALQFGSPLFKWTICLAVCLVSYSDWEYHPGFLCYLGREAFHYQSFFNKPFRPTSRFSDLLVGLFRKRGWKKSWRNTWSFRYITASRLTTYVAEGVDRKTEPGATEGWGMLVVVPTQLSTCSTLGRK